MEEDEDVVEGGTEFVDQNPELVGHIPEHGQDVFFGYYETLAREEYDVVVQLERFGVAGGIESTKASSADQFSGKEDGESENLIESGGHTGERIPRCFGESAKELLIDLRRGHQRCEGDVTECLHFRQSQL